MMDDEDDAEFADVMMNNNQGSAGAIDMDKADDWALLFGQLRGGMRMRPAGRWNMWAPRRRRVRINLRRRRPFRMGRPRQGIRIIADQDTSDDLTENYNEVGEHSSEGDASAQTVPPLIPPTCPVCPTTKCCPQLTPKCVTVPCPTCPTCPSCPRCLFPLFPDKSRPNDNPMMTELLLNRLLDAQDDDFDRDYDEL